MPKRTPIDTDRHAHQAHQDCRVVQLRNCPVSARFDLKLLDASCRCGRALGPRHRLATGDGVASANSLTRVPRKSGLRSCTTLQSFCRGMIPATKSWSCRSATRKSRRGATAPRRPSRQAPLSRSKQFTAAQVGPRLLEASCPYGRALVSLYSLAERDGVSDADRLTRRSGGLGLQSCIALRSSYRGTIRCLASQDESLVPLRTLPAPLPRGLNRVTRATGK